MKFYTHFDRPPAAMETNTGEYLINEAGYIPAAKQIMMFIQSGENLMALRAGSRTSDFAPDERVSDDYDDLTKSPDFDPADISAHNEALKSKARNAKNAKSFVSSDIAATGASSSGTPVPPNGGAVDTTAK